MRRTRVSSWQAALVAALAFTIGGARGADPFDIAALSPPRVVGADFFGTHFHRLGRAERGAPMTGWPAGMIGALRLWDSGTRWADIEPADGRFDFARLDLHVALAEAQGVPVLLVLGSPARWASARPNEDGPYGPGSAAEPRELADWDRYVSAIARRYRGRIAQYELWNEPYFSDLPGDRGHPSAFFTGSVATMVELARRARTALDLADPQARLLTPGFVGAANRLDLFLARGGARLVQGVAYHFYAESDPEFIRLAADVRAVMTRHGIARLPLYNTESGFALRGAEGQPAVPGLAAIDRRDAAARLARSMVLGAFLGLDRFYQYAWDNGRMGMLKDDGRTETDSLYAYAAVRRWLRGTTLLGCRMQPARLVRCEGERGDRRLFIAWRAEGGAAVQMILPTGGEEPRVEHALGATPAVTRDATGARVVSVDDVPVAWWSHIAARRTSASP